MQFTLSLFSSSPNPAHNKDVLDTQTVPWGHLEALLLENNWSPAVYHNGARNLSNYAGTPSLFAFDIDEGMTLEEAKAAFGHYQCQIHTSRNHQKIKHEGTPSQKPACDRFRVIFALSSPITTDADYKATWESYAGSYPLDKQTRSSSMFFFKGTSCVWNSAVGIPLQTVHAKEWEEVKSETYTFTKNERDPTRGKISARSKDFLECGAPSMFNIRLFMCAVDHLEQRYTQQEFLELCEQAIARGAFRSLDPVDTATVASAFNRKPKYGARAPGQSYVDAQKQEIVDRIMDGEFIQCVMPQHTLWYNITDFDNRELSHLANEQVLERHIAKEITKPENHYNTLSKPVEGQPRTPITKSLTVEEVLKLWRRQGLGLPELPSPILWRGESGWCHKRFNFELTPNLPHPAWDQFLSRLSDAEVFKAWVFSCFKSDHTTRQALWLLGRNGQDGKTRVINTIAEPFGGAAASITGSQLTHDSRFFLSQFLGKKLATYSDCKKTDFPKMEAFRNMTGGDRVSMEFKGGGFIQGPLSLKVLIGSNSPPALSSGNFDKSRLLVIEVKPSPIKDDPHWGERLKEELPAFLGDAWVSFTRLCPNNGDIQVTEAMSEELESMADATQEQFDLLFDSYFEVDPASTDANWVTPLQVRNMLIANGYTSHSIAYVQRDFTAYLEHKHHVSKHRRSRDKKNYLYKLVLKDGAQKDHFNSVNPIDGAERY